MAEKATLRRLIRLNEEIANTCYAGKESLEYIPEETEKKIFDLLQKETVVITCRFGEIVMNAMNRIEAASRNKGW